MNTRQPGAHVIRSSYGSFAVAVMVHACLRPGSPRLFPLSAAWPALRVRFAWVMQLPARAHSLCASAAHWHTRRGSTVTFLELRNFMICHGEPGALAGALTGYPRPGCQWGAPNAAQALRISSNRITKRDKTRPYAIPASKLMCPVLHRTNRTASTILPTINLNPALRFAGCVRAR